MKVKRYATFTTEVNGHQEHRTFSYWNVILFLFVFTLISVLVAYVGGFIAGQEAR